MPRSLPELDRIDRAGLVDSRGVSWREFRGTLRPRYARVWRDIGLGYAALLVVVAGLVLGEATWPAAWPLLALLGAGLLGYGIAYLQLFFHEAAHHLLAPDRRTNDLLANSFIGWMVGQDIRAYRPFHFEHHRHLGTPHDTERSYFDAVGPRALLASLTGLRLLRALRDRARYRHARRGKPGSAATGSGRTARVGMLAVGLAGNGAILGAAAWTGHWALFVAWPVGMLLVHPALNTLRQALEHRGFDADPALDYATVPHGVHTRTFGRGPIASTLGGAGFNRHLMHHWDPQLSYTRFDDVERFLLDTPARDALEAARASYAGTFLRLSRRRAG